VRSDLIATPSAPFRRRLAISLLGSLISLVAIVVVLRSVDLGQTAEALGHTRVLLLAPCIVLVGAGIVLRAFRWQRLLPTVGRSVPLRRITPILLIGYLGNSVLPARLGEPIRAYLLARREGLSSFEVLGTALVERIVDVAVLSVMAFVAAWAVAAPPWVVQLTGFAAGGSFLVILALTVVGLGPAVRFLERLTHRVRVPGAGTILVRLDRFAHGFGGQSQRIPIAQAAGLSVPIWVVDTSTCWLVAQSLGSDLSPASALLVIAVGGLGTSIPSAPGYIGTFELAASAAARAAGLAAPAALSLAIVIHVVTLLPVALAGTVAMLALGSGNLFNLAQTATEIGAADGER
jgi:glycosyltransferase 2 family protein